MDRAERIRQATFEARKACDMMWEVVLEELQVRNPAAAYEARAAASAMRVRPLFGFSTYAAARAWPYLDYQARSDWLWICRTMREIWIRGAMEHEAPVIAVTPGMPQISRNGELPL
jgi:hypothetical protein